MLVEELSSITIEDIMSVPIVVSASKSAYDAVVTMFLEDVGTLFVVDGKGCLFGVISRKDLLKASLSQGADLHNLPLAMVMTGLSKIVLSKPHEPAAAAARRLIETPRRSASYPWSVGRTTRCSRFYATPQNS